MWNGKYTGLAVAVVLAGVLASCSESGKGSGSGSSDNGEAALSVAGIKKMAADPGDTCPVSYDMAAALKAVGVKEPVKEGKVEGETADKDDPRAPLTLFRGALVGCAYGVGKEKARVFTVGTGKGTAVNTLLPQVQHDSQMDLDAVQRYGERARKAPRGKPLLTSTGNVASIRLPVEGKGDIGLILAFGEGGTALTKAQVTDLTKELAAQAHA